MVKRALGLSKKAQLKRQKTKEELSGEAKQRITSNKIGTIGQIQVELDSNGDPDNALVQLRSLWKKYLTGARDDELVLNAIVHECDRLLRQHKDDEEEKEVNLDEEFHSIYALALSELTIFKSGEESENDAKRSAVISEFFEAALDRVQLGLSEYPESKLLSLAKSKIIFQRIPLQYISMLNLQSTNKDLPKGLDLHRELQEGKKHYCFVKGHELTVVEPLDIFNDILDIVANFGREELLDEGMDSDEEDTEAIHLSKLHPLFQIKRDLDSHALWLREKLTDLFEELPEPSEQEINENDDSFKFYCKIAKELGQSFLDAASEPSLLFTTLEYEFEDSSEEDKEKAKEAQKKAIELSSRAVEYFRKAEWEEDPQSWIDTAEVLISLGNLQENESKEQESLYQEAEEKIRKANRVTNGKYQHILELLLGDEDKEEVH